MGAVLKRVAGPVAGGVLITSVPLVLGMPFYRRPWFKPLVALCDWPMMFVKEHLGSSLRGNETDRLLEFFSINVIVWSILIACVAVIRTNTVRNGRGN
jgi:hypothetical protein